MARWFKFRHSSVSGFPRSCLNSEGRREEVARPRVRRTNGDGSTEEARLETYASAQEPGELEEMLLRAVIAGAKDAFAKSAAQHGSQEDFVHS